MKERIKNGIINSLGIMAFRFIKSQQFNLIKKNIQFKNIHKGERCFILGNGPSLKEVDFSLLKKEYVFTVNQLARRADYCELSANYHLWSDFNFFDESNVTEELVLCMKAVNTSGNRVQCFFPADVKNFLDEHGISKEVDCNYFKLRTNFYEGFNEKIDFTKFTPCLSTVVHYAILLAVYMGFSEIYLLGVDTTQIMVQIKSFLMENDENDYSYEVTKSEKKRMEKLLEQHSLESYAHSFWHLLLTYRNLNEYCKRRDIKLINCSKITTIDSIPRVPLECVLCK